MIHHLADDRLSIAVSETGAELQSLCTLPDGAEWLSRGDAFWTGRAPLLFPVIGRSPDGQVTIAGKVHEMAPHGFTRDSSFSLVAADETQLTLALGPDDRTKAAFPFDFRLEMLFRLEAGSLLTRARIFNRDRDPMPFQFGFHPAFAWPLPGAAGQLHRISLPHARTPVTLRPDAEGLMRPDATEDTFADGTFQPQHEDFQARAMVLPEGAGDLVIWEAAAGPSVTLATRELPVLAFWQVPGAPWLCIEPWSGMPPFTGDESALETRPGARSLAPGGMAEFTLRITPRP